MKSEINLERLNKWQNSLMVHPFTCPNRGDGKHEGEGKLTPTKNGWICSSCDYVQPYRNFEGQIMNYSHHELDKDELF